MGKKEFAKLAEPVWIGSMRVKNRIVFPPMNTNLTSETGCVTPELEEYYIRRAKGGAGLIILEAASVSPDSRNHPRQPMICDRRYVASWARLTEKLHRYGARVSVELVHYGSEASMPPRVSPSGLSKYKEDPGRILNVGEIRQVQQQFVDAAVYAKQSGIDAVTLHACHGYLIAEFLSPVFNQREDAYGGSFENRCRFLLEIIEKCRSALGSRYPIMVRYSADEFIKGGRTIEEAVELAKVLEAHGVDAIDISASQPSAYLMTTPPYCLPRTKGLLVPYSEAIKQAVKVPVFTAIGIRDPEYAEQILSEGKADLIALGRPQIADPDYAHKALHGCPEKIRHCLSCEYCLDTLDDDRQICCAVNPEAGREAEFAGVEKNRCEAETAGSGKTGRKKRIAVIGGGPAGMEAARAAAEKGCEVVLFEQREELGGTLNAAKIPPNKEMLGRLSDWYVRELQELKVDVRLGTEATEEMIDNYSPDVLFLACGSHYIKRIKGSDLPNVMNAYEALTNPERVGKNIVIVGGGASGAEAAEYFSGALYDITCLGAEELGGKVRFQAERKEGASDKNITVVEMLDEICSDMDVFCREAVLFTLEQNGVRLCASRRVEEITGESVRVYNLSEEKEEVLKADTVILAGGLKPNGADWFRDKDYPVIRLGDAAVAGKIKDAIYTAYVQAEILI